MGRLTENKIILVTRATRLEELVARFNTEAQAKFYVEHLGADFSEYEIEDRVYKQALMDAQTQLRDLGRLQVLDRHFLPNFIFGREDTVVVLGQDGLVANTLKYLDAHPVIAVNPDPGRWDGVLLPFRTGDLSAIVKDVFNSKRTMREITMAKAELNNGQRLYAVNDLFVGQRTHLSARYRIDIGSVSEQQSSSGIIVSTGLGATGWFKSIMAGVMGIGQVLGQPIHANIFSSFTWEANYLYYTVREPFPSKSSTTHMVFGELTAEKPMKLVSQMPENGVIFSDGIEQDHLEFNSGTQALITVAEKKGHLVI